MKSSFKSKRNSKQMANSSVYDNTKENADLHAVSAWQVPVKKSGWQLCFSQLFPSSPPLLMSPAHLLTSCSDITLLFGHVLSWYACHLFLLVLFLTSPLKSWPDLFCRSCPIYYFVFLLLDSSRCLWLYSD